ncbi:DMT family transporter [Winogradskyella pulchriflava]|uniref:DMT family transporter n=1 Tax=Winogradskyella pulchriflava TaxID=1110688 RepID=A0ABV6Q5Y0_9FLAO
MNEKSHLNHLLLLTIGTILISTSGALGKFIDMPTPVIIWWRAILAALFLFIFCLYKGINLKIKNKKNRGTFFIAAVLMGAHWITYFYALKLSNVAIGMLSIFTFPVIIALLEPLFYKTKLDPIHIVLGLMVLLGIYILSPDFSLESGHLQGILFGVLSALCYAIRILILKGHVANYNSTMLMFYQVAIIGVLLAPVLIFMDTTNISTQYPYVILLALMTTAIGHTLFVNSLKYFKASTASIIGSIQPVTGIIIAYFFLNEIPTIHTFVGGALILATVIIESIRSKTKNGLIIEANKK